MSKKIKHLPEVCILLVSLEDDKKDVTEFINNVKKNYPEKYLEVNISNADRLVELERIKWQKINDKNGEFTHPYFLVVYDSGPSETIEDACIDGTHFEVAKCTIINDLNIRAKYMDELSELYYLNDVHFREKDETIEDFSKRLFE